MPPLPFAVPIRDLPAAARGAIGLSRANRMRTDMARNLYLYEHAKTLELPTVTAEMEGALLNQAKQLRYISQPQRPMKWDWRQFFSTGIVTAICIGAFIVVWVHVSHPWWAYVLAAPFALLGILLVIGTFTHLFALQEEPPV